MSSFIRGLNIAGVLLLLMGLGGCGGGSSYAPIYHSPVQQVYRIDAHRYLTMSNYKLCTDGGIIFYHDDRIGIKSKTRSDFWRGRLSVELQGQIVVLPLLQLDIEKRPGSAAVKFQFSTDDGKTFSEPVWGTNWMDKSATNFSGIFVKGPRVLVVDDIRQLRDVTLFTIKKGMSAHDLEKTGIRFTNFGTQNQRASTYSASRDVAFSTKDSIYKAVKELILVRTPSGQNYYRCDISIRPKSFSCSYGNPVGDECILKGDIRTEDREIIKLIKDP